VCVLEGEKASREINRIAVNSINSQNDMTTSWSGHMNPILQQADETLKMLTDGLQSLSDAAVDLAFADDYVAESNQVPVDVASVCSPSMRSWNK
jgi:hypothetical protein